MAHAHIKKALLKMHGDQTKADAAYLNASEFCDPEELDSINDALGASYPYDDVSAAGNMPGEGEDPAFDALIAKLLASMPEGDRQRGGLKETDVQPA